jgi:hypothetical protein
MLNICEFLYLLKEKAEARKSCDGSGQECNEVTFADSGIVGALLNECLVARISLEFSSVSSFS